MARRRSMAGAVLPAALGGVAPAVAACSSGGEDRLVVYNPEFVAGADLPDSVVELAAPEYAGRVSRC